MGAFSLLERRSFLGVLSQGSNGLTYKRVLCSKKPLTGQGTLAK